MKKLILLLFIPLVSFGQSFNTEIYYGSELCQMAQKYLNSNLSLTYISEKNNTNLNSDNNFSAELAYESLDKILFQIGASRDKFIIQPCPNISNALATQLGGVRYILYDPIFMTKVSDNFKNSNWGEIFILAHEVGHHINNHSLDLLLYEKINEESKSKQREQELDADLFAAFIIARLGGSYEEITSVIKNIANDINDHKSSHPSLQKRLEAVKVGFERGVNKNGEKFYNLTSLKSSDEYFNRALINELKMNFDEAIFDYNKAIEIDPFNYNALYRLGVVKREKGDYFGSIKDFTRLSEIYFDWVKPYSEIGKNYYMIGDYNSSIRFFTISIEKAINATKKNDFNSFKESDAENFHSVYYDRGQAYLKLNMIDEAYNDFRFVIEMKEDFDLAYSQISKIYTDRKEYDMALSWIIKAIEINPVKSRNYFNRAVIFDLLNKSYSDSFEDSWTINEQKDFLKNQINLKIAEISDYTLAIKYNKDYALAYRSRGLAFEYIANRLEYNQALELYLEISEEFKNFYSKSSVTDNAYNHFNLLACSDWSMASKLGNTESKKWVIEDCN